MKGKKESFVFHSTICIILLRKIKRKKESFFILIRNIFQLVNVYCNGAFGFNFPELFVNQSFTVKQVPKTVATKKIIKIGGVE
jgi:hypothetical protein